MTDRDARGEYVQTNAARWLAEHGDYLYRYAMGRVRQPELAEDLVQETFLAALRGREQFKGGSSERTWLVSILKRKIVDHLRLKNRERAVSTLSDDDQWADKLFDERGNWRKPPPKWPSAPGAILEKQEFWAVFTACLRKLPDRLASVFTLRELDETETAEVCKVMDISATNLWVMLHRARLALWRCLEINWFRAENER